jgi:tetratricopeptide (TPR) repeat protein
LRVLREEAVSAAAIRQSIVAMKAVAGMTNPLLEATLVKSGARVAFRHDGSVVDPITGQLLFDFERLEQGYGPSASSDALLLRKPGLNGPRGVQELFLSAVQTEESGDKINAIKLYQRIMELDPSFAPAWINLGTIHFHLREFVWAEQLYRHATEIDPAYVLAFFDLGNVLDELQRLDESIEAYRKAVALAPRYADAHYNLALAYERKGEARSALRHWESYLRLDKSGPWADHARGQIRKLLDRERITIAWRAKSFVAPHRGTAPLKLVSSKAAKF